MSTEKWLSIAEKKVLMFYFLKKKKIILSIF